MFEIYKEAVENDVKELNENVITIDNVIDKLFDDIVIEAADPNAMNMDPNNAAQDPTNMALDPNAMNNPMANPTDAGMGGMPTDTTQNPPMNDMGMNPPMNNENPQLNPNMGNMGGMPQQAGMAPPAGQVEQPSVEGKDDIGRYSALKQIYERIKSLKKYLENIPPTQEIKDLYRDLDYAEYSFEFVVKNLPLFKDNLDDLIPIFDKFAKKSYNDLFRILGDVQGKASGINVSDKEIERSRKIEKENNEKETPPPEAIAQSTPGQQQMQSPPQMTQPQPQGQGMGNPAGGMMQPPPQ